MVLVNQVYTKNNREKVAEISQPGHFILTKATCCNGTFFGWQLVNYVNNLLAYKDRRAMSTRSLFIYTDVYGFAPKSYNQSRTSWMYANELASDALRICYDSSDGTVLPSWIQVHLHTANLFHLR